MSFWHPPLDGSALFSCHSFDWIFLLILIGRSLTSMINMKLLLSMDLKIALILFLGEWYRMFLGSWHGFWKALLVINFKLLHFLDKLPTITVFLSFLFEFRNIIRQNFHSSLLFLYSIYWVSFLLALIQDCTN